MSASRRVSAIWRFSPLRLKQEEQKEKLEARQSVRERPFVLGYRKADSTECIPSEDGKSGSTGCGGGASSHTHPRIPNTQRK
ncbi:hypothetical protein VTN49DRAFT_1 [Thermomyces lanuginosus]|uniref:uncharacterized protein n=1 Tax=Thermomyces lanuginosus TaxID=5541 RepID=UPI003743B223